MSTDVLRYDTLGSTSEKAARLAPSLTRPTWIVADRQTAARGRRGRPWSMPPGNFAATLVTRPGCPLPEMALRSFTASLALHDALSVLTGAAGLFALKWPNDVLMEGGKLAGILLETAGPALLIGIGVNLAAAPDVAAVEGGALPPVALAPRFSVTPDALLDALSPAMARWEQRLSAEGFAPVRDEWQNRAARLGQPIRARTGRSEHRGVFEGIATDGALILRAAEGRRTIPAADVYFR